MTTFILLSLVMVVIALALLLPSLWRTPKPEPTDRTRQNITIVKEQLSQLEASLAGGEISQQQYEQTRNELEASLLDDIDNTETGVDTKLAEVHGRWTAIMLILIVPMFVVGGYFLIGTPQAINNMVAEVSTSSAHESVNQDMPSVEAMLSKLEERLKNQPDDAEGWFTLGRTYMTMGRYNEAVVALERVYKLAGDHPSVLLSYADALTMARGGKMQGQPFELVKKALALEPQNPTALWLVGIAYDEQGEYKKAIDYWQQLEPLLADNPKAQQKVRDLIAQAKQRLGEPEEKLSAQQSSVTSIRVSVKLSPELKARAKMDDTVFIFARASQGPPMPLAVVRKQVKDLPVTVTLDDGQAMMPSMKLSNFDQVVVSARVSASGQATVQKGDLQSRLQVAEPKSKPEVELLINEVVD